MEVFKESKKSICHKCKNIKEICDKLTMKNCETDKKIGKAFVSSCSKFNKHLITKSVKTEYLKVAHRPESRVEMMGGGHDLIKNNE